MIYLQAVNLLFRVLFIVYFLYTEQHFLYCKDLSAYALLKRNMKNAGKNVNYLLNILVGLCLIQLKVILLKISDGADMPDVYVPNLMVLASVFRIVSVPTLTIRPPYDVQTWGPSTGMIQSCWSRFREQPHRWWKCWRASPVKKGWGSWDWSSRGRLQGDLSVDFQHLKRAYKQEEPDGFFTRFDHDRTREWLKTKSGEI